MITNHRARKLLQPSRLGVVIAAVALSAGTAVAFAEESPGRGNHSPPQTIRASSLGRLSMASGLSRLEKAEFAIFREARNADNAPVPSAIEHFAQSQVGVQLGVNPALARQVPGILPGGAWVLPGIDMICIMGAGGACGSTELAASGRLYAYGGDRQSEFVFGMVPDGVSHVTVALTNGSSDVVAVQSNLYFLRVSGDGAALGAISGVTFAGGARLPSVSLSTP